MTDAARGLELYGAMLRIRLTEQRLQRVYEQGRVHGPCHMSNRSGGDRLDQDDAGASRLRAGGLGLMADVSDAHDAPA